MDLVTAVLAVLVLAVLGGGAALVARGAGWWTPPRLPGATPVRRLRDGVTLPRSMRVPSRERASNGAARPVDVVPDRVPVPETTAAPTVAPAVEEGLPPEAARLRAALRDDWRADAEAAEAAREARLARIDERVAAQGERLELRLEALGREAVDREEAAAARTEAALERLRADLAARDAAAVGREVRQRREERRAEVTAELYARLARLEAAVAAVTNPILLPGEPYAPPDEFLAESLAWENWKDVGERAFAFADAYNAQRLFLSEPARAEVADFVGALRALLTRCVYPNLHPDPSPAQLQALRAGLDDLAAALPRLRARLEEELRSIPVDGA